MKQTTQDTIDALEQAHSSGEAQEVIIDCENELLWHAIDSLHSENAETSSTIIDYLVEYRKAMS